VRVWVDLNIYTLSRSHLLRSRHFAYRPSPIILSLLNEATLRIQGGHWNDGVASYAYRRPAGSNDAPSDRSRF